jgi:hypothetical protein
MKKIISFVSNRPWLTKESKSIPTPTIKSIPEWYRKADRFYKKPEGDFWIGPDGGKIPTWKSCPALLDVMGTGYILKTPCDIEFRMQDENTVSAIVKDEKYKDFCSPRGSMPQFEHPKGYYENHFAWFPDWGVETPKGYSVLYSQPFNRFELPFLTTSGIIDNDKVKLLGSMPFFLIKGFEGIIPAGTPFAQLLPFKREDWESEIKIEDGLTMHKKNIDNASFYRVPDGGIYKNKIWEPRRYE